MNKKPTIVTKKAGKKTAKRPMREKTKSDADNSKFNESNWLEVFRDDFIQTCFDELMAERKKLGEKIVNLNNAGEEEALYEAMSIYEDINMFIFIIMGDYIKAFDYALKGYKVLCNYNMTASDCFALYCKISDYLPYFILQSDKGKKISYDVLVLTYITERKKLDSDFEECLKKLTVEKHDNNNPVSETIELMIKNNKLLPKPNPATGKYITSDTTPWTIKWLKAKNLHSVFPAKLFDAMIETKCKPEIIKKYYRDL